MNRELLRSIRTEEINIYHRDGVVLLRKMFDKEWIDRMLAAGIGHINNPSGRRGIVDDEGA